MALAMTPEEFEAIRAKVIERRAIQQAREALHEMEETPQKGFVTTDSFLNHLDTLLDGARDRQPRRSRKKAQ